MSRVPGSHIGDIDISKPLIIAHRDASADAPGNTLAAFEVAFRRGADGLEFDVRRARASSPPGPYAATHASFRGEPIPTLARVFELAGSRSHALYAELKFGPSEDCLPLAARVAEEVKARRLENVAVVESFNLDAVKLTKQPAPDVRTAVLFERTRRRPLPTRAWMLERAAGCLSDEAALHHSMATRAAVDAARRAAFPAVAWTVDHASWATRAHCLGLRAPITNRPARMRAAPDALFSAESVSTSDEGARGHVE
jgi:glycerophosphoryl diester phosphodiesterase